VSELVRRLIAQDHDVHVMRTPDASAETFKAALDRGHVHLTFPGTAGGTSIGVRLDPSLTNLSLADFEKQVGTVAIAGTATLDFVRVQCIATISLRNLAGTGRLETWNDAA
jgi:hypothetical protein